MFMEDNSVFACVLRSQGVLLVVRLCPGVHGTLHRTSLLRIASASPADLC